VRHTVLSFPLLRLPLPRGLNSLGFQDSSRRDACSTFGMLSTPRACRSVAGATAQHLPAGHGHRDRRADPLAKQVRLELPP
jgi:hypothetical protein